MEELLRQYPPPGRSSPAGKTKINGRQEGRRDCGAQPEAGLPNFDMNAALDMYPPGGKACRPAKKVFSSGQTGQTKNESAAETETDPSFDCETVSCHYPPKAEDLARKGIVADPGAAEQDRHKGEQRYRRRQELKRRGIDDEIDLHGLFRNEAGDRLSAFFRAAQSNGLRKVRIVHGKGHHSGEGRGVLQSLVWDFLEEARATGTVWEFSHPSERDGGRGATVVLLSPGARK
ncbi:Smr/MutS family protein [Candidatus Haliotispira prima]|uniref:Smr/MutS family protein n=1 Tax=Candidatus Haliotispira prima TaxID=3034016 RepID=A0ABY8MJH3_9SPIO|nr:Smr/MutS family protein [Candidatus Haliotispira prima]